VIPGTTPGSYSALKVQRGALVEYANTPNPLSLSFEFNPATISRTRGVTVRTGGAPGTRGGYDFADVREVARASAGACTASTSACW